MRIWDVPPDFLCRSHLLGEHRELHAIWSVITQDKKGYSRHPETLRWRGKLAALYRRHDELVAEMQSRGYSHSSPLDRKLATGFIHQDAFVDDFDSQLRMLSEKGCDCLVQ
uniref:Pyrimidine dimer DNA glycosylase n=1 Tax=uncultured Thermoplasmata archaeon TaxID=376542 RepID=A0A871Y7K7_9ARCH|nr:Pyrimidine dimer DNA glycosylase [uncultured Thermoplasmata archaeon]